MNRWDEVQGAARDIADWVCAWPDRLEELFMI